MCRGGPGQRRLRSGVGVYEDDSGSAEPRVWGKGQSSNLEPITAAGVGAELTLRGTRVAPCHSSLPASLAPHPCDCKYGAVCVASVLVHRKHERKVQRGPEAEKQGQLYGGHGTPQVSSLSGQWVSKFRCQDVLRSTNTHYKAFDRNVSDSENNLLTRCRYASTKHSPRTLRPVIRAGGWAVEVTRPTHNVWGGETPDRAKTRHCF